MPNLYPAVGSPDGGEVTHQRGDEGGFSAAADPLKASRRAPGGDQFRAVPAAGAHEVIVNTPDHQTSLLELDDARFAAAITAWRERSAAHAAAAYVHLIVNEGPAAGASLEHTHAQLYALDFVPADVARERERARAFHERTQGGDLLGEVLIEEVRRRERLVAVDDDAVLLCPFASSSPFHLRVVPRAGEASYAASDAGGAGMIRRALEGLAAVFGDLPQYNLWIRTAPRGIEEFTWHAEIVPRLVTKAGFELGTGVDINTYPPERACADLREALG